MPVQIPKDFDDVSTQMCRLRKQWWSVPRLHQLVKDLPVFEIPLQGLNVAEFYDDLRLRDMVMHFKAMMRADMSYPIILDEDGELMDGRHRIMRALYEERETILAVRFAVNPTPCRVD